MAERVLEGSKLFDELVGDGAFAPNSEVFRVLSGDRLVYGGRGRWYQLSHVERWPHTDGDDLTWFGYKLRLDGTRNRNGSYAVPFTPVDEFVEAQQNEEITAWSD